MKKILLILTILLLPALQVYSQYSLPIRLVSSTGTPLTGQAGNIEFTSYPHSYPGDVVSGITVTEVGTAGNYVAKGFTTWEYVKLWISGTNATWFDSVQVGDITAYITTRLGSYVTLSTGQTVSGIKSFSNTTYFGGLVQQTGNYNFEMYKPQLHASSPWATYLTLTSLALIPKYIGDSDYVPKTWMYNGGSGDIRLQSGYKLYGRTNTTSPISINSSHFQYAGDQLSLLYPVNFDSVTIKKDTTISEATYSKLWSLKRRFFSQNDSFDVRVYYKNTYPGTSDSMYLLNVAYQSSNNTSTGLSGSTWVYADTLTLPTFGTWQITYNAVCVFPASTGSDAYDSIFVDVGTGEGADKQLTGSEAYITHWYDNSAQTGGSQTVTWSFVYHATSDNRTLFLRGKNSTAAGGTMYINRSNVTYTRIK